MKDSSTAKLNTVTFKWISSINLLAKLWAVSIAAVINSNFGKIDRASI